MKIKYTLLFTFCILISNSALAQRAIIKGRISEKGTGSPLSGAVISVAGTNNSTSTDLGGEYQFYINSGEIDLHVKYLGYRDTTIRIGTRNGEFKTLDIPLSSRSRHLENVEVSGYTQGQSRALNQQKNADNIKNIVAADQMGQFPDPNAAEALQRVPGVTIERDQGEGRYVSIRGLAPQFTNININGEQIPSPEADVRFVALDAIPSDQLASIEVSKALTPDMDGDAIGGSINMITRTAHSSKAEWVGSLGSGYNNLMGKPNVQGQLQYGQRFGRDEKFGLLLNGNYYHNELGSDNFEREVADNELELRDYELKRTRLGLSTTMDYTFDNNHEVYFKSLYSRFTDREFRRRFVFVPDDDEIEKLTKHRFEAQSILTFNAGARHSFQAFFLDYEGQYSYGEQDTPYDQEGVFIAELPSQISFPSRRFPTLDATGYTNNALYEFDEIGYGNTLAKDRNLTAKINVGIPYKWNNNDGLIKFGAKVRSKKKDFTIQQNTFENLGGVPNLDQFSGSPVKDRFLSGEYDLGNPLDLRPLNQYFNQHPQQFELQVEDKNVDEALEAFTATENVTAAYLMGRQQFQKLMVLAGVRYEQTRVAYNSSDVIINDAGDLEAIVPVVGSSKYDFVLPQLHLKYELDNYTNVRAAATYSYARPNFAEIIPAQEINREDRIATLGNANLKPVNALNLDLMMEHYFGSVGIASIGVFHKQLDDFIYRRILFNSPYPLTGTPSIPSIDVIQAQNGNEAYVTGLELAFQRRLYFIPALKNFSLYINYTYTHSNANIQARDANETNPNAVESIRLPGQATHVGNASIAYEGKRFSIRPSINFNGQFLSEVGGIKTDDIYVQNRLQLDVSASYAINHRLRLFTEWMNLTNQPLERYQDNKNITIQKEYYSFWTRFGVKFNW